MSHSETLLITGGAGFIGSNLVRFLLRETNQRVINLDKLTYAGNLASLAEVLDQPRHVFVEGDIADRTVVKRLLDEYQPWAVMNLAAESHVDRSIDGPLTFVETNVLGTVRLLEAVRAYWTSASQSIQHRFRFLHVSTDEVYGSLGPTGSFAETARYAPASPYAASKGAADHFVQAYYHTYGLPTLLTNCSNNYGPFQFPEKLIPLMILRALAGQTLPVYGDGLNVRDWLFEEDHCRALMRVLEAGRVGDTYNIGGGGEMTNLAVVRTVCQALEKLAPNLPRQPLESLITFVADRPGHDRRYAVDTSKIRTELGWSPRHTFAIAIEATVRWYLENQAWIENVTSGKYRGQRLGLLSPQA